MKGTLLSTGLELLSSRSSELIEQYYSTLIDLENIIKYGKVNVDNDHNLNYDAFDFDFDTNDKKASCGKSLERLKRKCISSILLSNTHSLNNR